MSLLIFSFQNAFRKKTVAALAILGVAFGVALMTFLFSLAAGMGSRVERTFNTVSNKIIISGRDAVFSGLFFGVGTTPIPSSYIPEIKNIPHVEKVYTQVSAFLRSKNTGYILPLFGYRAEETVDISNFPGNTLIEGTAPVNEREIIIGKNMQDYLKLLNSPFEIGNTYRFITFAGGQAKELELKVTGTYQTGNEVLDEAFSGSEKLVREVGKIPAGSVSAINVSVDHVHNVEAAVLAIQKELSGKKPEVQVTAPTEVINPVKNLLGIFAGFLLAVSLVAMITGGLTIMVVMLLSVINRMREFGILKALGWTPANIIFLVLIESLILSLLGTALGTALGGIGIALARALIASDIAVLTWQVIAGSGLAGICIGVAGGIYPAWRANSAVPAKILRAA